MTNVIAKIFATRLPRDKRGIFRLLKSDVKKLFPEAKYYAVGSRARKRGGNRLDFDVLILEVSIDALERGLGEDNIAYVKNMAKWYGPNGADYRYALMNFYKNRVFPYLHQEWARINDEYGNPVSVDLMFSQTDAPDHAILI